MLNIDATISSNLHIGGLGGVFRNSSGDWILGFFARIAIKDIMQLEIQALFLGLQLTVKYLLRQLDRPALAHVYREQNRLVDSLAKRAISTADPVRTLLCFGRLHRIF
ncbi:uncharacterized protein LOC107861447 [Capsicum annuum]|uniref:uncharacterized protein LOC107861447 n=1 Tax=Capsicum annuum TaxID=4072 RepID=UPI0007BEC69C|nr:uncharacterized protein LOC107861447 [Capsicum annuum]